MRSLFANGVAMLAARLVGPALSFAITVGVARACGPETLGLYVHLLALLAIFQTAAGAGLTGLLTRELAARPGEAVPYLRRGRTLAAASGAAATAAFLVAAGVLAGTRHLASAALLASTLLPSAWIAVHEAFFMATRTHHRLTLVAAGENALKLGLALLAFRLGGGLELLCAGVAVSRAFALAASAALVSRAGVRGAWRPVPLAEARGLAVGLAPFAALLVLSMAYFRLDVLMVDAALGSASTGLYGAALSFYTAALILPDAIMGAVYPRLAARHGTSTGGYAEATRVTVRLVTAGMVPVSVGLICLSDLLLRLAFGGRYAGAAPVLRLLAASLPVHAANAALGQALLAGRFQGAMVRMVLVSVACHAALGWFLLVHLGLAGAPISVTISSALFTAWATAFFHRKVPQKAPGARMLLAPAAVAAPVALTLAAPPGWTWPAAAAGLLLLAAAAPRALLAGTGLWRQLPGLAGREPT